MGTNPGFEALSTTEQVVLLCVATCERSDETPVQTHEVRHACRAHLESTQTDVVGTVSEADVMRSLYRLEDAGFLEEAEIDRRSPTGKGRPAYALAVDAEAVEAGVDDRLLERAE